jgi:lysylphosphatidylglycerol synthetase-like protein (DUF2156 family)
MTRSKTIQAWFAAVALISAAVLAYGVRLSLSTWLMTLAVCLVPPAFLLLLWNDGRARSISEVIYDAGQRR